MNDRPKRNTQAGEAPQRATSGQNVPKSGERANAGTRRRNGAGSFFGENGKGKMDKLEKMPMSTSWLLSVEVCRKRKNILISVSLEKN